MGNILCYILQVFSINKKIILQKIAEVLISHTHTHIYTNGVTYPAFLRNHSLKIKHLNLNLKDERQCQAGEECPWQRKQHVQKF